MPIWSAGTITITQDKPTDPSYLFNLSNVSADGFNYSGSSLKTRHSVVSVSYFNMDSQEVDFEVVEDATLKSKIGTVVKQVKAFACTSRNQARRLGRAILFAENNESEVVAFSTSIDSGAVVRPGAIIEINDPVRAGVRRGGRLKAVTSTTVVTVDDTNATDLPTDGSPTLGLILPNGNFESKSISAISDGTITVSEAFSQTPNVNTAWILSNTSVEPQLFRVITVEEQDGINYAITALSYVEGKYAFIEDGTALPTRDTSSLTDLTEPPGGLAVSERIFPINNQAISKLIISWQPIVGVVQYQVNYRFEDENFISEKVSRPDFEIINSRKGTYEIQVFSYNILDQLSATSNTLTFQALGKTALPQDVSNLLVEPVSDQFIRLRFDKATDIDVTHGGNVVVRHSNLTDGTGTFTNSVDIIPSLPGSVSETLVPAVDGEYILKFRDDGGRLSSGETSVVVTTPDPLPKLSVFVDREDTDTTPFSGTKVNTFFDSTLGGLVLASTVKIDSVTDNIDSLSQIDILGDIASLGSYSFASTLDLGGKQPLRLTRNFVTESFYPNSLIDSRTALIDVWTDIDAVTAFDTNAKLLVATTDSDPDATSSATYSQSGTTITITKNSHGFAIGSFFDITFTSGSGVSGNYEVKTKTANTFTVTATSSQSTSGNCTLSSEFTNFSTLANGTFIGRGFKFKAELTSADPAQSIILKQLGYSASLERRTETPINVIASGTSQKSVTFINSFFTGADNTSVSAGSALPAIGITIENMQSGDFFELSSITGTGFNIDIKNGSSHVDRNFKYTAIGFGRGS